VNFHHPVVAYPTRLLQLFWRWSTPFWLFRDASRGTIEQRSANYRYNRAQREVLPSYAFKWMAIAAGMLILLQLYSGMLTQTMEGTPAYFCAALFCISSGIGFSFSCVVITLLMTCYLFFSHIKE
jgi:hypothetical protein